MRVETLLLGVFAAVPAVANLVTSVGTSASIPGWFMQSSKHAINDLSKLSTAGTSVNGWYRVGSKSTVMVRKVQADAPYDDSAKSASYHSSDTP